MLFIYGPDPVRSYSEDGPQSGLPRDRIDSALRRLTSLRCTPNNDDFRPCDFPRAAMDRHLPGQNLISRRFVPELFDDEVVPLAFWIRPPARGGSAQAHSAARS